VNRWAWLSPRPFVLVGGSNVPVYEYACKACGNHLEVSQSFKDAPLTECPQCSGPLRKVFGSIGIVLKGSGFYRTDSRVPAKKADKAEKADKSDAGGGSGGGGSGDKAADAKPAAEAKPASDAKASTGAGAAKSA